MIDYDNYDTYFFQPYNLIDSKNTIWLAIDLFYITVAHFTLPLFYFETLKNNYLNWWRENIELRGMIKKDWCPPYSNISILTYVDDAQAHKYGQNAPHRHDCFSYVKSAHPGDWRWSSMCLKIISQYSLDIWRKKGWGS